ncbi:holin family protein [Evansella sp. LMS18]|jgi:toxin secretion/phage lysis holin|uniref:phage holin family protein n=1 Tax=Evansella sp. LMS18 TaxID=2924033 RepID=UPI0034E9381E
MMVETAVKTIIGIGGAALSFLFGGWTGLLAILVAFVVLDYITGLLAAYIEGKKTGTTKLSSKAGFTGIARKLLIFALVAAGHLIDKILGNSHLIRETVIFFYIANEALSIIENAGRAGVPVPDLLKRAVHVFKKEKKKKE